jgi:O-glycosyl hydrolase
MKRISFFPVLLFFHLLAFNITAQAETANIYINDTDQTIAGFGGMNFPRWIPDLTSDQVDKAFGNGYGQIGLSILRISVPSERNRWSGEVQTAQRAKSRYGAKIIASPWSPPASYKTNNSTTKGSLKRDYYDDYANWLRDFVNYMSGQGASLYAISLQNEPDFEPDYESCGWSTSQMRTFLNNHASVIPTRIIAPETVHYKSAWMDNLKSSSQVDILANHAYGGSPSRVSGRGNKQHWMTEHAFKSNGDANNMSEAVDLAKEVHDFMTNGYNAYVFWYIRRAYGLLTEDGNVSKRGYAMAQFSKFVRPGFVRVRATDSPTSNVYVSSYKQGNTLVVVAVNRNSSSRTITLNFSGNNVTDIGKWETTASQGNNVASQGSSAGGSSLRTTLSGRSVTTFRGTIGGRGGSSGGGSSGGGSGDYKLMRNYGSNMCMRVENSSSSDNANIIQEDCQSTYYSQQFSLDDLGNGYFHIKNRGNQKCLRASGDNAVQYTCHAEYFSEQFTREQVGSSYIYRNRGNNQCLRVENSSSSEGASIVFDNCDTNYWSQRFSRID